MGRHAPISKQLRDGILRVGKSTAQKPVKQSIDDWFKLLGENHIGELLRLYAQVCNHRLAPYLTQVIQDRSLLDPGDLQPSSKQQQQSTIPVPDTMPATPDVLTTKPESVGTSHSSCLVALWRANFILFPLSRIFLRKYSFTSLRRSGKSKKRDSFLQHIDESKHYQCSR